MEKLRKFKILKNKIKLKKLNRQKLLVHEISNNYKQKLYQIYKDLKFKYLHVKNKINSLTNNNLIFYKSSNIKQLKKKLKFLKLTFIRTLNQINKIVNNLKFGLNFVYNYLKFHVLTIF